MCFAAEPVGDRRFGCLGKPEQWHAAKNHSPDKVGPASGQAYRDPPAKTVPQYHDRFRGFMLVERSSNAGSVVGRPPSLCWRRRYAESRQVHEKMRIRAQRALEVAAVTAPSVQPDYQRPRPVRQLTEHAAIEITTQGHGNKLSLVFAACPPTLD